MCAVNEFLPPSAAVQNEWSLYLYYHCMPSWRARGRFYMNVVEDDEMGGK